MAKTLSLLAILLFIITKSGPAQTGACCCDNVGECVDNVDESDCPSYCRFAPDTFCDDIEPP